MDQQYSGKVVVVTGASSGIGSEIARELARRGASVVLVARRQDKLTRLSEEIAGEGGQALAMPCDVTDDQSVNAMAKAVREAFGQVHLLVNNAGRELMTPLAVTKPAAARELLDVNVVAMAEVTRCFLRLLKRDAAVVNMASVGGLRGAAGLSLYCASKGAVISFTRSLARELATQAIRVNAVAPGMVKTEMAERMLQKLKPDQIAELEASHPLGFGTPKDVAAAVAFLGSDEASWITGHTLVVDGGLTA
jgi:NAD(P)-dependent dehydrogenase (short-subunit alcohol dehydrogenase family)